MSRWVLAPLLAALALTPACSNVADEDAESQEGAQTEARDTYDFQLPGPNDEMVRVDAMVVYSVFQYVFAEGNAWDFLDRSLSLLAPGGRLLIGDIPNITKRKRFFASDTGVRFHQAFTQSNEVPRMDFNVLEPGNIDDSVVLAVVARARMAGFDA